jgi:hypothetical protein
MVGAVFGFAASQLVGICCASRRAIRGSPYALADGGVKRGGRCKRGFEEQLAAADPAGWRLIAPISSGAAELAAVRQRRM